jgi:hypothetical protein
VLSPGAGSGASTEKRDVVQAVQTVVSLINNSSQAVSGSDTSGGGAAGGGGSPDKPGTKSPGPAASENSGAKNDKPATKTYCN